MPALPTHCAALGLTLEVRLARETLAPVPESAWIAGEWMERPTRVAVLPLGSGRHRLALDRYGDYTVDARAGWVAIHQQPEAGIPLTEVLEGPVLLHALAHYGIHALHASAFQRPDGCVCAFTADSGTGKSSLAARALQHGWTRVADDLLALSIRHGMLVAHPALWQPKLPAAEQPGAHLAQTLPLSALYQLKRVAGPARQRPLDRTAALRLLLQSTVASRVYTPACLAAHLRFAAQAAEYVHHGALRAAVLELPDRPADVAAALDEALALLQG
jgi:hypothetical protein